MNDQIAFMAIGAISGSLAWRYTSKNNLSSLRAVLFSTTVVCATLVLQLVFWEILEIGPLNFRKVLWKWLIFTLLVILGFVYPVFHLDTCTPVWVRARSAIYLVWVFCGYCIYLFGFIWLSHTIPIAGSQGNASTFEWIRNQLLASNALIGVTMMAALCGISSVIAPYTAFFARGTTTEAQLQQVTASVASTQELLAEEEHRLARMELEHQNQQHPSRNLVGRLFWRGDESTIRLNECREELETLDRLLHELRIDKEDIEKRLMAQRFDKTPLGRLVYIVYCVFAAYCVYRLFNGYRRMAWYLLAWTSDGENGPRDALVTQIAEGLHKKYTRYSVDNWTRIIGIFMSGIVIVTSMNGIFSTLRNLKRRMRPNMLSDPLLISHVFGIYAIACATVLRLNIPKNMSGAIISALKFPLEVSSVQLWNDLVLCVTSTVVIAGVLLASRDKEQIYDEEMEKYD